MEAGEKDLKNGWKFVVCSTPDQLRDYLRSHGLWDEAVLAGGEAIYRIFLEDCDELILTEVAAKAEGADTYFPDFSDKFSLAESDGPYFDGDLSYSINTYRRKAMKQYIIDSFTPVPFAGNPAAVCVMDSWPREESMMKLARENNLSETAFLVKEEDGYRLRWFTPGSEVDLCGHATLASSFVVLNYMEPGKESVRLFTRSGVLTVTRKKNLYEI